MFQNRIFSNLLRVSTKMTALSIGVDFNIHTGYSEFICIIENCNAGKFLIFHLVMMITQETL